VFGEAEIGLVEESVLLDLLLGLGGDAVVVVGEM